jgi:hypothetical protein
MFLIRSMINHWKTKQKVKFNYGIKKSSIILVLLFIDLYLVKLLSLKLYEEIINLIFKNNL